MRPHASYSASTSRSRRSRAQFASSTATGGPCRWVPREQLTDLEVAAGLPDDLGPGTYTVAWRVVSADSHPIRGAFVFAVGRPGGRCRGGVSRRRSPPRGLPRPRHRTGDCALRGPRPRPALSRRAGLLVFGRARAARRPHHVARRPRRFARSRSRNGRLDGRHRRRGARARPRGAAAARAAAGGARDVVRPGVGGTDRARARARVDRGARALRSLAGPRGCAGRSGRRRRARGHVPALGHARVEGVFGIASDATHTAAAGAWVGGLAVLGLSLVTAGGDRRSVSVGSVPSFSALALVAVAVLLATGIVNSIVELPELAALWESTYGQLVLAKSALLAVLVAAGGPPATRRAAAAAPGGSGSRAALPACRRGRARRDGGRDRRSRRRSSPSRRVVRRRTRPSPSPRPSARST